MARYRRGKVALYEVINKSGFKSGYGGTVEKLHPEKSSVDEPTTEKSDVAVPKSGIQWWRRPRIMQFNAGRIEFSLPYPVAIVLILGIILLVLVAFRFGQFSNLGKPGTSGSDARKVSGNLQKVVERTKDDGRRTMDEGRTRLPEMTNKQSLPESKKVESAIVKGSNIIVLVEYPKRADLVPVQKHFAGNGIQTEIVNWSGRYFLITKDRFEEFGPGSDGYQAKQKIVEVGAKYKAPQGYETFAPNLFKDAYGKKIE